jgi:hypothetical protein
MKNVRVGLGTTEQDQPLCGVKVAAKVNWCSASSMLFMNQSHHEMNLPIQSRTSENHGFY